MIRGADYKESYFPAFHDFAYSEVDLAKKFGSDFIFILCELFFFFLLGLLLFLLFLLLSGFLFGFCFDFLLDFGLGFGFDFLLDFGLSGCF